MDTIVKALGVAVLLAGTPSLAAEPWNIPHEKQVVLKGRVVDALCQLKGRCAPDCGAGKRQLGLALSDGTFRLVAKSNIDFAGATGDLAGYCGREIEADGLLIENPAVTLFFVQRLRERPDQDWIAAERFKADWEARNSKAEEWWRGDPQANRIIAEDGPFGVKGLAPKPKP
ncbi:hypothetical protein QO058_23385 [Bosea vestrisii]|uniref:hypothetical protein n=1 Tax=Bosea vestrisii TaxID=151416 RepID=UPI0024DF42DF|nr:hypothetical protein [Bosea vestrisii]WID95666.1 hypothetical protein QO058_23385 [Bosea vestrisii]